MDEDTRELVRQLCTRAGMLLEDASLMAVTMTVHDAKRAGQALRELAADIACVDALVTAAARLISPAE